VKANYALVNNTHGVLIWLFVIGFPLNWVQAIIYVAAIFFVWVWAGEWNPIYKLNMRYRKFLELKYETSKKLIIDMETSFHALLTSQWVFIPIEIAVLTLIMISGIKKVIRIIKTEFKSNDKQYIKYFLKTII